MFTAQDNAWVSPTLPINNLNPKSWFPKHTKSESIRLDKEKVERKGTAHYRKRILTPTQARPNPTKKAKQGDTSETF